MDSTESFSYIGMLAGKLAGRDFSEDGPEPIYNLTAPNPAAIKKITHPQPVRHVLLNEFLCLVSSPIGGSTISMLSMTGFRIERLI